jgi:uncharacterized protein (TIGR04141 family)
MGTVVQRRPPVWKHFLQSGTESELGYLSTQSSSALVGIEVDERIFCIVYGSARHWIRDENIERRFGMIVTLNTVHHERVRSVDREEFDTITRKTRSQTSVSSSFDNFGLDVQRDLVRSVTGEPEDSGFASYLTGADNLILSAPITFSGLGQKCREIFKHFGEIKYKEKYRWIDNFQRVSEKDLIQTLEDKLFTSLQDGINDNIFLSPPILIDTQESHEFRYPSERVTSSSHPDLRLSDLLQLFTRSDLTIEWLKKRKIREFDASTDSFVREFSVYDSIVYEVWHDDKLYALSQGEWYRIAHEHVTEVLTELELIEEHTLLVLPDALPKEREDAYNSRASAASGNTLSLLDRKPVNYGGGRSSVEVCDLLDLGRNFIHVKAKTKSSTLSHLFSQGLVSGQLMREPKFRELALLKCDDASHHHIFLNTSYLPSHHSVTYAIITAATGAVKEALPFFSKQSLVNAARELRNMGYTVWIKKISIAQPS